MPIRTAERCTITNADALTARIPMGVITPRVRRTSSLSRLLVAAAASLRAAGVVARVERVAAGARMHCVRVVDREPGSHQAVDVVDLRAPDVADAEVVEGHPIRHAGAAAAADEDA